MLNIKLICVGKLKEKFYIDGSAEYAKRLGAYCRLEIEELPEERRPANPSSADTAAAVAKEAAAIKAKIPRSYAVIAMCVEGKEITSEAVAELLEAYAASGASRICFLIGGSDGLDETLKKRADLRLSMSKMTFPHHLARVMLLEQIYRGFKINEKSRYHK
ncbi:MAG: 23S rRNA (pseudouridine(1915)-N(3))-methyltransferase RlmH [Oscillospiraceae bacterium]